MQAFGNDRNAAPSLIDSKCGLRFAPAPCYLAEAVKLFSISSEQVANIKLQSVLCIERSTRLSFACESYALDTVLCVLHASNVIGAMICDAGTRGSSDRARHAESVCLV